MADIRYTLEHSGDYIADVLEKAAGLTGKAAGATWSATKSVAGRIPGISLPKISLSGMSFSGSSLKGALSKTGEFTWSMTKNVSGLAKGSARGVIITYDINRLRKEKKALAGSLAERFIKVYGETSRPDLTYDADASELLARLAEVEKSLAALIEERSERLFPTKPESAVQPVIEPSAEVYAGQQAAGESLASEAVAEESFAGESPAESPSEAVAEESPAEALAEEMVAEESSAGESFASEAVAEESPAEESFASDTIIDEADASEERQAGGDAQTPRSGPESPV